MWPPPLRTQDPQNFFGQQLKQCNGSCQAISSWEQLSGDLNLSSGVNPIRNWFALDDFLSDFFRYSKEIGLLLLIRHQRTWESWKLLPPSAAAEAGKPASQEQQLPHRQIFKCLMTLETLVGFALIYVLEVHPKDTQRSFCWCFVFI